MTVKCVADFLKINSSIYELPGLRRSQMPHTGLAVLTAVEERTGQVCHSHRGLGVLRRGTEQWQRRAFRRCLANYRLVMWRARYFQHTSGVISAGKMVLYQPHFVKLEEKIFLYLYFQLLL